MSLSEQAAARLEPVDRIKLVASLDGWTYDVTRNAIRKAYRFGDFIEAFTFMSRVALLAERLDHHPEWMNVYDRVEILLTTHDAADVSMRDVELARLIDCTSIGGSAAPSSSAPDYSAAAPMVWI